jgi:hypothetical protein
MSTETAYAFTSTTYPAIRIEAEEAAERREPGVWLSFYRALRPLGLKDQHAAYKAGVKNAQAFAKAAKAAADEARYVASVSDEVLMATVAKGEGEAPGSYREAVILLTVPVEHRHTVLSEAHTFRNMTPDAGRWSDALRTCANRYRTA